MTRLLLACMMGVMVAGYAYAEDMDSWCFYPQGLVMLRRPTEAELDEYFPKATQKQIDEALYQPGSRPGLPWELSKYCLDLRFGKDGGNSTSGPIYKKFAPTAAGDER